MITRLLGQTVVLGLTSSSPCPRAKPAGLNFDEWQAEPTNVLTPTMAHQHFSSNPPMPSQILLPAIVKSTPVWQIRHQDVLPRFGPGVPQQALERVAGLAKGRRATPVAVLCRGLIGHLLPGSSPDEVDTTLARRKQKAGDKLPLLTIFLCSPTWT